MVEDTPSSTSPIPIRNSDGSFSPEGLAQYGIGESEASQVISYRDKLTGEVYTDTLANAFETPGCPFGGWAMEAHEGGTTLDFFSGLKMMAKVDVTLSPETISRAETRRVEVETQRVEKPTDVKKKPSNENEIYRTRQTI